MSAHALIIQSINEFGYDPRVMNPKEFTDVAMRATQHGLSYEGAAAVLRSVCLTAQMRMAEAS